MKIFDKYIIRQFLINFVLLTSAIMLLFVLVDLIVDLDEFIKAGKAKQDQFGGRWFATLAVMGGYYGPLLPLLYTYFSGLLVVAAMGFTLTSMQRNRELVAAAASGISLFRIAAPMLLVGIMLNVFVLPIQEFVIPPLVGALSRSKSHLEDTGPKFNPIYYAIDENGHLLSAGHFDSQKQQLKDVAILERDASGIMTRRISATQALWNDDQDGWELIGGHATYPSTNEDTLMATDGPESVTFFSTQLSPTVVSARQQAITMRLLSLNDLQQLQANQAVGAAQRGKVTQVIWSRFSMLLVNVLILAMTLPIFLVKLPDHYVAQAARAATLCLGAWGSAVMMMQMSSTILNPVASAWLPVVIYLPLSAVFLQRVDT